MIFAAAWLTLAGAQALAGEVSVAVAANFVEPAKAVARAFQTATGDTAVISPGASGQLFTQITHGAPYEVFLSADAERPQALVASGYAVAKSRFTYAVGRLALYSATPGLVDGQGLVLKRTDLRAVAIADPAVAPYGVAAEETMRRLGVYDALKPKIVKGASVAQAYQFVATGAAEIGFVAQSQIVDVKGGSRWLIPDTLHAPITQEAVLLTLGAKDPAAQKFLDFLKSPAARAIIARYGYDVR
jgi:molybdate transport system substrate-binding protein